MINDHPVRGRILEGHRDHENSSPDIRVLDMPSC